MKPPILFLEQQSWRSGAQRVLEEVLEAVSSHFHPIAAFPEDGVFVQDLRARGIETVTYPLGLYRSGQKSLRDIAAFASRSTYCGAQLSTFIRRRRVQLVYVNGPRCLAAGALAAWLTGRPSLFHLHLTLSRKTEALLTARLARYVSLVLVCSKATAEPLLSANCKLARKIHVLYNPVVARKDAAGPSNMFEPQKPRSHVTIGMAGRLTEAKGHSVLLTAVAKLKPKWRSKIQILFAGAPAPGSREDESYVRRLQSQASQLNLQEQVLWVGYQENLAPYYASLDVLVQPSFDGCGEAMPLTVLEALASGVPVIASRTGGIPEVVCDGENGLLIPPADDAALTRALERLMHETSLRERLQAGARTTIDDRFSPVYFRSAIREHIGKLCGAPAGTEPGEKRLTEATGH